MWQIKEAVAFEDVFTQQISHHYVSMLLCGEPGTDWQVEKHEGKEGKPQSLLCLSSEGATDGQREEKGNPEKERGQNERHKR